MKSQLLATSILLSNIIFACSSYAIITISEITTDFGGGWTSGDNSTGFAGRNSIQPDINHNLTNIAFLDKNGDRVNLPTQGGTATGGILAGQTVSGFRAFSTTSALTREVIYGSNEDGDTVNNAGAIYTATEDSLTGRFDASSYLTDGANGLGIGSGANNVSGTFTFNVASLLTSAIDDGVPDILLPQIAVWNSGDVTFAFRDNAGMILGVQAMISSSDADSVGRWRADRWEFADTNPDDGIGEGTDLFTVDEGTSSEEHGRKNIRIYAFDFIDFGLTAADANNAATLEIVIPGEVDPAFVAYNQDSIVVVPEPSVSLLSLLGIFSVFTARKRNSSTNL